MTAVSRGTVIVLCTAALSLTGHAQRASSDWLQWRGPSRNGIVTGFTAPAAWPDTLTQRWRVEVGHGYASPIIVGDRVYVFSRRGDNEGMSAHDIASGKEVWRAGYDAPYKMHSAATPHNQGPKSTPVFVSGKLLSIGMTGIVTAWDAASGKQLWQKPGADVVPLYTTHAFSPMVDGNNVIFHVGGHGRGALTALDINSGTARWSWPGDGPSYGSPIIVTIGGTRQLVVVTQDKIVGVDPASGTLLWERAFPSKIAVNSGTPVMVGDTVVVGGSDLPTQAFTPVKSGATWTTTTVWENNEIPLRHTNMVVAGDVIFGITTRNSGQYFAVNAKTGQSLWVSPGRQATAGAIARLGDVFVSLENDGELLVVKNSPTAFDVLKRYKVADGETWAEPVFSGNRVFIKDLNHLTLWTLN